MSWIQRKPPGDVIAHVPFDDCFRATPRRRMPPAVAAWARGLPVPRRLARAGLAAVLREAVPALWSAWQARFRQGLRIEREGDARVVVHCDTVRYRVAPGGEVTAEMPRPGGGYEPILVEVGTPFPSWTWVRLIAQREPEAVAPLMQAIHAHRQSQPNLPVNARPGDLEWVALEWLAGVIEGLARRCVDGLVMRHLLRDALGCDAVLLDAARRAKPRAHRQGDVSSEWWNQCIAHRQALLELRDAAPGLLPLYGELMQANQVSPGRLDWTGLRARLGDAALPHSLWRFMKRDRAAPVWRMQREGAIGSIEHLCDFLGGWARVHLGLPPDLRLPDALWKPLARTSVNTARGLVFPPVAWPVSARATGQAIKRFRAACACGQGVDFIENEWAPVVRWAANYAGANSVDLVRYWGTARRLAAEDERRIRARNQDLAWPVPLATFEHGDLRAIALSNGAELAEEAIAMRHCADRHANACMAGEMLIYGLRDRSTQQRVATVSIELRQGGARLGEVARSLNRPPSRAEITCADALAKTIDRRIRERRTAGGGSDVEIPPAGPTVLFMERNDSDVYAFIESTGTGWKGYKYTPCGTARPISGVEAVETLNPWSWSPMRWEDFVVAVQVLLALRRQGRTA